MIRIVKSRSLKGADLLSGKYGVSNTYLLHGNKVLEGA